jgi:hypothetical protein
MNVSVFSGRDALYFDRRVLRLLRAMYKLDLITILLD